jgi:hypothetical protein
MGKRCFVWSLMGILTFENVLMRKCAFLFAVCMKCDLRSLWSQFSKITRE